MTFDQIAIVTLLVGLLAVFAFGRFRPEAIAFAGLAVGYFLGVVPSDAVFSGFAHPAVVTVVEVLVLVRLLQDSHALDFLTSRLTRRLKARWAVVGALCGLGALVSVFMNNVGALALMFPITLSVCARTGIELSHVLMPLSFATLLGGTCALVGTPANLVVSDTLLVETGAGFSFFDLGKAGFPAALAGVALLALWPPRLFAQRRTRGRQKVRDAGSEAHAVESRLIRECRVPDGSEWIGRGLDEVEQVLEGRIYSIVRGGAVVFGRRSDKRVAAGDELLLECAPAVLDRLIQRGDLRYVSATPGAALARAVVTSGSVLLGSRIGSLVSLSARGVAVEALHTRFKRVEGRFADLTLSVGDVLLLSGPAEALPAAINDAELLALDPPRETPGGARGLVVAGVFTGAVLLAALNLMQAEIAFGLAIATLAVFGQINLLAAARSLNWPIVLMLAAMIPLGETVHTTGAAAVIAQHAVGALPSNGSFFVTAAVFMAAVALTPFVNNATAAVVLSPVAVEVARSTGAPLDALLAAVSLGVSLDFLTPIGHHNNTIVMGAADYRFGDFLRLGAPLLAVSGAAGFAAIAAAWLM